MTALINTLVMAVITGPIGYVTVRIYDEPVDGMEPGIYFNGSKVKKVIKTNNAYIYDLEDYIQR